MLNKCMIIGNLGVDPEMRYTENGTYMKTFLVSTSRQYYGTDGERREETEWFSVVTWARLAETCSQYLSKGRQVFVEGRMRTRSWEDQEGRTRYRTELIAENVKFLGGRDAGAGAQERLGGVPVGRDGDGDVDPDDLPF
ncbi:MAG: single-stranded DNA-binding protein [Chloroflexi bacterium]|nr:single-stranded DNA-binding protein [Chloroflexota bacterium]